MTNLMKKILLIGLVLMLIFLISVLLIGPVQSNYLKIVPEYTHSHTKAICTEQNFCQDYEIFCKDKKVVKMNPITGAVIQFSEDWQDPRDEELRNGPC